MTMSALRSSITSAWTLVILATAGPGLDAGMLASRETDELLHYARDTWASFEAMTHPGGLPADRLLRNAEGRWAPDTHTSTTDVAAYLWSVVAAEDLRIIDRDGAGRRLDRALAAVSRLERAHGFFFNWYDARSGARLDAWPIGGAPMRPFLSTVDNGWLAAALIVVGNARPEFHDRVEALLGPMDFRFFYDPYDPSNPTSHPGHLRVGYFADTSTFTGSWYGMLNSEARIASYVGIARGQLPAEHYYRLYRTLPPDRRWQGHEPAGEVRAYAGVPVFEGHYTYRDLRVVPSWGGSMFEALMVPLFVPEDRWAPRSWGLNHPLYVRAHLEYGLRDLDCGFWGFSPARGPRHHYGEYGVGAIATKPGGYPPGDVEESAAGSGGRVHGVVTPYASFLALGFARSEALANLRSLAGHFAVYGRFGFADSVDVACGRTADAILAVDQGMILAAIANALDGDVMKRHFCRGPVETAIRPLIAPERFTAAAPTIDHAKLASEAPAADDGPSSPARTKEGPIPRGRQPSSN
ncbi:MAG: DUF3131 domain-containing protein [Planctomycetaceae bacterium]|nr:DUF3131 domain-containing protein [Planctomycetaceae bacterium]